MKKTFPAPDLVRPELHDALLEASGLRGLDTAAVEVGVEVTAPLNYNSIIIVCGEADI